MTMNHDTEPTIQDVLVAMNIFSTRMDQEFVDIRSKMVTKDYLHVQLADIKDDLHEELDKLKVTMVTKDEFNNEITNLKGRLTQIVTKGYLDDKLSDLRGEFFLKTGLAKSRTA